MPSPSRSKSIREQGLRRKRREQAYEDLELTSSQRIEAAGQLYLELAALLSPEALMRDTERRLQAKRALLRTLKRLRS